MRIRVLLSIAAVSLVTPTFVRAQAPAETQIQIETVIAPLLNQAEVDMNEGRHAMARARAEVVIRYTPAQSDVSARARGVHRGATSAMSRSRADEPTPPADEVYVPLLAAAERDVAARERALADARLRLVLRDVPPGTPTALRANELAASLDREALTMQAVPPTPPSVPPPSTVAVPPPATPGPGTSAPPQSYSLVDPDRRGSDEIMELYIASISFGIFTGVFFGNVVDIDDPALYGLDLILFGLGGGLLTYGLDSGDGMRKGVPTAISTGLMVGLVDGLLAFGSFHDSLEGRQPLTLVWGTTFFGGAAGAVLGYAFRPSIGDSRLVASGALWGAWFTFVATLATDPDDSKDAFRFVFGGFNVGLLAAVLASGSIEITPQRIVILNLGLLAGALVGAILPGIIAADDEDFDDVNPQTSALSLGVGSIAGLVVAFLLTQPSEAPKPHGADADAFRLFAAPSEHGGAVVGATGQF